MQAKIGVTNEELEATEPSETMTSYTSYMLNVAQLGGVQNVIAAVLAVLELQLHRKGIGEIAGGIGT